MNIQRFQQLAEIHGGDLSRWPENERKTAAALLRADPAAQSIIDAELALDAAFDCVRVNVDDGVADRVFAAISRRIDTEQGAFPHYAREGTAPLKAPRRSPLWPAGFLVVMGLLGVVSGALTPAPSEGGGGGMRPQPVQTTAVANNAAVAGIVDVADAAGYYSTRFLVAWDQ